MASGDCELIEMNRLANEIVAEIDQVERDTVKRFCAKQGLIATERQIDTLVAALREDREREKDRPLSAWERFGGIKQEEGDDRRRE